MVLLTGCFWLSKRQQKVFLSPSLILWFCPAFQEVKHRQILCFMQNAKPSLKQVWIHGWVTSSLTYASLVQIFSRFWFHSLKVTYQNSHWYQWELNGAIRLLTLREFLTKEMKYKAWPSTKGFIYQRNTQAQANWQGVWDIFK